MPTKREEERAARVADIRARASAMPEAQDSASPDVAFAGAKPSPEDVQEFVDLPESTPQPFSRDGRDYYVDPSGGLHSVVSGFDAANQYPGLAPATEQQVHARDIQKRSGSGWDQLSTFVETGAASGAEAISGLHEAVVDPRYELDPQAHYIQPEDVAPFAYTPEAEERREANPKSALAGAITTDLAATALVRGAGPWHALRTAAMGGLTGAGSDAALSGEPFKIDDAVFYGLTGGMIDAVGSVAWGEAMRALGKRRSAIDGAVEGARAAGVADAVSETDPVRRAGKLQDNAEALYERHQVELDQALETVDDRIVSAPEKMFSPGQLKRSVSSNTAAQAAETAEIARKLDQAAQVTGNIAARQAAEAIGEASAESGPQLFAALRQARKILREAPELSSVLGQAGRSPLIDEATTALEDSLKNEKVWGRAAKHHAAFAEAVPGATANVNVSELGTNTAAREALEARLERARQVAASTGDKRLTGAVKAAQKAIAGADAVTGARLMGPIRTAAIKAIKSKGAQLIGDHIGKLGGGIIGGALGGVPGAIGGTLLGSIAGDVVAPYVGRAVDRVADKLGNRWTRRVWKEASGAVKRHPTKILGAGLLGLSAATADSDESGSTAAASVGLLSFFLPGGGRGAAAKELGGILRSLSARERMLLRMATERTSRDVEGLLYNYARGEHGPLEHPDVRGHVPDNAETVRDAQYSIQLNEYARRAGIEDIDDVPEHIKDALHTELKARNAALVESDPFLLRLAQRGRLEALAPVERQSGDLRRKAVARAEAALQPGDMPQTAHSFMMDLIRRLPENLENMKGRPAGHRPNDPTPWSLQDIVYNRLGNFQEGFERAVGRRVNPRETAYVEARMLEAADEAARVRRESSVGHRRDQMEAIDGGPLLERLQRAADTARAGVPSTAEMPHGASIILDRVKQHLADDITSRAAVLSEQKLDELATNYAANWLRQVDREFNYSFETHKPKAVAHAEAELRLKAHQHYAANQPEAPHAAGQSATQTDHPLFVASSQAYAALHDGEMPQAAVRLLDSEIARIHGADATRLRAPEFQSEREYRMENGFQGNLNRAPTERERAYMDAVFAQVEAGRLEMLRPRVIEGGGEPVQGSPDFRRLGLPEPTQGEVPIQMKLGLAPPERPLQIEGDPIHNVGDRALDRRRMAAMNALPEADMPQEAHENLRRIQGRLREANMRTWSDADIPQAVNSAVRNWTNDFSSHFGEKPSPAALEYVRSTLDGFITRNRDVQIAREALTFTETREAAERGLREGDMPEHMDGYWRQQQREMRGFVGDDTTSAEITERARHAAETFHDKMVVEVGRPPNAREKAAFEAALIDEGEAVREITTRRQKAERRAAESRAREQQERKARNAAEEARIHSLMNGLDMPDADQQATVRRAEAAIRQLNHEGGLTIELGVRNLRPQHEIDEVLDQINRNSETPLTPGQEIFLRDQLGNEAPPAERWIEDAIDELVRADEWSPGDSSGVEELDLDDVLRGIERSNARGRAALTPWEEFHVRRELDDNGRAHERRYERDVEEIRSERKQQWEEENPPESEEGDDYRESSGSSGSWDRVEGLPDAEELEAIGLTGVSAASSAGVMRVFGQELSVKDCEQLFGLDILSDYQARTGNSVNAELEVHNNSVHYKVTDHGLDMIRVYEPTPDGFKVYHSHLFLPASQQDTRMGTKIIRGQFEAYERLGASKVSVSCADVGKYLWPSIGFQPDEYSQQRAITSFLGQPDRGVVSPYLSQNGLVLPDPVMAKLGATIGNLRDLADATVPVSSVERHFARLEAEYRRVIPRPKDFRKTFIRGEEFKLGKHFLLTQHGDWNSSLRLDVDSSDEWFREAMARLAAMSATALAFSELADAYSTTDQNVTTRPAAEDATGEAPLSVNAEQEAAKGSTREKLSYLQTQARSTVNTTARALTSPTQKLRTVSATPGVTQSVGVSAFVGNAGNVRAAYDQKKDTLAKLRTDPMALVEEMADGLADLSDAAPEVHRQVVAKTFEIVQFLQSKLPSTIGASLTRPEGSPPSDFALRQFALYYSAATNPSSVHQDLANNRARKEQMETLQTLWPDMYSTLKAEVVAQLADSRPTVAQRSRLDVLFGFGDALDRAFSSRVVASLNEYRASKPGAAQQGGPPGAPGGPEQKAAPTRRTQPSIVAQSATGTLQRGPAAPV